MTRILLILPVFLVPLLAACSMFGADDDAPKLSGDRIDVTVQPTLLAPNPAAQSEVFALPQPHAAENWSQVGGNPAHAPGHVSLAQNVTRAWSYSLGGGAGKGTAILNPPVVDAGRIFAINTQSEITALGAKTGKRLWRVKLPLTEKEQAGLPGGLAVLGNLLFATTAEGQVFALTASTGKQVWVTNLAVPLRAAPTVEGERVFVTSHDNRTFALSALDGALLWTHSGMEEVLGFLRAAPPASANGVIAVPYSSGEVYVLRASDGRYIWHDTMSTPFSGQDPESTVTAIAAPPVIADGLLYAVGINGGLAAYELTTGRRFWKADVLTSQMPVVAGYQIFAVTDDGEMVCLNRRDGSIRWVTKLETDLPASDAPRLWSGPVLAGGRLIAVSSDGIAVSIKPDTGGKLAAAELRDPVSIPPIVTSDGLFFLTDDARLISFQPGAN